VTGFVAGPTLPDHQGASRKSEREVHLSGCQAGDQSAWFPADCQARPQNKFLLEVWAKRLLSVAANEPAGQPD